MGRPLALYARVWQLKGGRICGVCCGGCGGDRAVVAEVAVRQRRQGF
ncbi:hypothetical protein [uncultured Campylobacter sp.]|nr:hypothetical protein [uncultured Campylobacter sp.]